MNARRKARLRRYQKWQRARDARIANKGEPVLTTCKRCGKMFMPRWHENMAIWSRHCGMCEYRNLHDGLGLPTPPALIDKYSLRPALTDRDYQNQLRQPDRD